MQSDVYMLARYFERDWNNNYPIGTDAMDDKFVGSAQSLRSRQKSIWDFFIRFFFHFPTRCLHFWVNTLNFLLRASTRVLLNDKLLFIQLIHGIFIWNIECERRVVKATAHFMKIYLGEKCVSSWNVSFWKSFCVSWMIYIYTCIVHPHYGAWQSAQA